MNDDPPTRTEPDNVLRTTGFQLAVGAGVRRAREWAGRTQDDIARCARAYGLAWDRAKVAALERGDKAISAEEFVLMLAVLNALRIPVDMSQLLSTHGKTIVFSGGFPLSAATIAELLAGGDPNLSMPNAGATEQSSYRSAATGRFQMKSATTGRFETKSSVAHRKKSWRGRESEQAAIRRARQLGLAEVPYYEWLRVQADAGEAEEKAARKLGESVPVILAAAVDLWGRSLTAEREARVAASVEAAIAEADAQAMRATAVELEAAEASERAHRDGPYEAFEAAMNAKAKARQDALAARAAAVEALHAAESVRASSLASMDADERPQPRRLQAIRGHVTRQLLEELAGRLAADEPADIQPPPAFLVGDRVEHHHHGAGRVVEIIGSDDDVAVHVEFESRSRYSGRTIFRAKNLRALRKIDPTEE